MLEFGIEEVLTDSGQPVGAATMAVVADVPEHTHAFIEIAFVIGGSGRHSSSVGARRVQRGDVVTVRPGSWHAYDRLDGMAVTNAYVRPALFHRELSWLMDYPPLVAGLLRAGVAFATVGEDALGRAVGWLDQLERLGPSVTPAVQLGLATCALGELAAADFTATSTPPASLTPAVRSTMAVLEARPEHPWTLAELAGVAMVSASSLQRQYRGQVGQSPMAWLRQLRGERAATLLGQTDLPVAEIGRRVGWEDPNYMSRRFRLLYGVGPSRYRERFQAPRRDAGSAPGTVELAPRP